MDAVESNFHCKYHYDPLDRITAVSGQTLAPLQRFYLQKRLVTQTQGARSLSLLQAPSALLAQLELREGRQESTVLATDMQQSVLHAQKGNQRHATGYTAYGFHPLQSLLSGLPGFNGELPDAVTGHYLLGNGVRAFNPVLMRFNSPDSLSPFGKGGLNSYAYCAGDPVNNSDPSGHFVARLVDASRKLSYLVKAPAAVSDKEGLVKSTAKIISQALKRAPAPHPPMSAPRQALDDAITQLQGDDRFVKYLASVNRNFASHGDDTLSMSQAMKYAGLAKDVDAGNISNTYAHASAAAGWWRAFVNTGDRNGLVGAMFNAAGFATSGPLDHKLRITGEALRKCI